MGVFATGVAVITTTDQGSPVGTTANAITSVSLSPPMLLVCLDRRSRTCQAIKSEGRFTINVLDETQEELSRRFASTSVLDRFEGVGLAGEPDELPRIGGCLAHVHCEVSTIVEAGDHDVVMATVRETAVAPGRPLLFVQGTYRRLEDEKASLA